MPDKYDLRRLKQIITIAQVLAAYRLEGRLRHSRGELVGPCFLPGHRGDRDNPGALRINPVKGAWRCFTHCGGGDLVELVAHLEGGSYAAAARALAAIEAGGRPSARRCATPAPDKFVPYTRRLRLQPDHPLLRARGITPQTAATFEAGWWPLSGFLRGCVGVRLHDPRGRPLGYAGRRVDPLEADHLGKWKVPPRLPKAELLFNWHRARPHLRQRVVLVEGPFDAMRVWQTGLRSVVALLGDRLSPAQAELLATVPEVVVMLDGDRAGLKGARQVADALPAPSVRRIHLPRGRDPADLHQRALVGILSPLL